MVQVEGFVFEEEDLAVKAGREADGVRFIRQRIDLDDAERTLRLYNKMVQEKVFETPVGYAFLYGLQEELALSPYIDKAQILPITVTIGAQQTVKKAETSAGANRTHSRKAREASESRARFLASLIINFILAAALVAMLIISYVGENVTILNYENKIINRYEEWEQELEEREKAVSEYEERYHITHEE